MTKLFKKSIPCLLLIILLLGCTLTTYAYDLPKWVYTHDNVSLTATPIEYETSKYPVLDKYGLWVSEITNPKKYVNINYTNISGNIYTSGTILLGVKLTDFVVNNFMSCINLNGLKLDQHKTYVATYTVNTDYYATVRLEPSYSIFGRDMYIKTRIRKNENKDYEAVVCFWIYDALLMDGFTVSSGKYSGKANVLRYLNADAFSTDSPCSIGEAVIATGSSKRKLKKALKDMDIYFNGIKVADDMDFIYDD